MSMQQVNTGKRACELTFKKRLLDYKPRRAETFRKTASIDQSTYVHTLRTAPRKTRQDKGIWTMRNPDA